MQGRFSLIDVGQYVYQFFNRYDDTTSASGIYYQGTKKVF